MMHVEQLLEKVVVSLATDPALTAYCQEHYGRGLALAYGIDPVLDGDEETVYPRAAVSLNDEEWCNTQGSRVVYELDLALAVEDSGTEEVGGVPMKIGFRRANRLRELAVFALGSAGIGKVEAKGGVDQVVLDPRFASYATLIVTP